LAKGLHAFFVAKTSFNARIPKAFESKALRAASLPNKASSIQDSFPLAHPF
jgi:hypothetical protein